MKSAPFFASTLAVVALAIGIALARPATAESVPAVSPVASVETPSAPESSDDLSAAAAATIVKCGQSSKEKNLAGTCVQHTGYATKDQARLALQNFEQTVLEIAVLETTFLTTLCEGCPDGQVGCEESVTITGGNYVSSVVQVAPGNWAVEFCFIAGKAKLNCSPCD